MKQRFFIGLILLLSIGLIGVVLDNRPVASVTGSEAVYYGTVTDRAISDVNHGTWPSRPLSYVGVLCTDGMGRCFWEPDRRDLLDGLVIGDRVRVECVTEQGTDLLMITAIEKEKL